MKMHLDRWAVWGLAHPDVQVFALPSLKEQHIVAIVEIRQLVELVQLGLGVELRIFPAVG